MNGFTPDKIIVDKTAAFKKPDINVKDTDTTFYLREDEFDHRANAWICVVVGFHINADKTLLDGLKQCDKQLISQYVKYDTLRELHDQTIWLSLSGRSLATYGPEAMLNVVQNTTKTHFVKVPPKCVSTTKYQIGDLKTRVVLIHTNRKVIIVYNGYMFHNVILYAIYRYGLERVFRAFVAAGLISSNILMQHHKLRGEGLQPNVYPDFHFSCAGQLIPAHRVILDQIKYFNTYFASSLYSDCMIMPSVFTAEIVSEVIDLIYKNKIADHEPCHRPLIAVWFGAEIPLLGVV
jgi:hypothetical protein